jgi:hypothetical protein
MGEQIYQGSIAANGTQSAIVAVPAEFKSLGVSILSSYTATGSTTGVKLQMGVSIDGGATYSDLVTVATTAPATSSGNPVASQQFVELDSYKNATNFSFKLVNLDGSNAATVTLTFRAAE